MILLWMTLVAALGAPLTADEAVARALDRSVEVARAEGAVAAADGAVRGSASLRYEPMLQGRASVLGEVYGLSVRQPVSLSGEGIADRRRARAALAEATSARTRTRLAVAADARIAWMRAVEATQGVALAAEGLAQARRLREGADARLATGDGSALEARLARLQETEARARWMGAVVAEGEALGVLAAATGVDPDAVALPDDPLAGMPDVGLEATGRADVAAARQAAEAARARLARERSETLPPVQLGAFYELEEGDHRAGLSVGVTVPVWRRNVDGRAEALAAADVADAAARAQERVADVEQAATARVLAALAGEAARDDPREDARLALDGVVEGYARGELDLLTAALMRQQILDGRRAWLAQRRWLGEARVAASLARDGEGLLPATP